MKRQINTEIRQRKFWKYVNDLAGYTDSKPEAVFSFDLDEIKALEDWVPSHDSFYKEVVAAREKLEELEQIREGLK